MANSVVKVTDIKDESFNKDNLYLLVGEDGTITPDQKTLENYLRQKEGPTNIQIMKINKTDKQGSIDISVDNVTYVPDAAGEELKLNEVARNLYNFRLDHDYTPLLSPRQQGTSSSGEASTSNAPTTILSSEPPPLILSSAPPQKGKAPSKVKVIQSITIPPPTTTTSPAKSTAPVLKPELPSTPEKSDSGSTSFDSEEKEGPPSLSPMVPVDKPEDSVPEDPMPMETSPEPPPLIKGKGRVGKGEAKTTPKIEKGKEKGKGKATPVSGKKAVEDAEASDFESYDEEDFDDDFETDDDENDSDFECKEEKKILKAVSRERGRRKKSQELKNVTPKSSRTRTKSRTKHEEKTNNEQIEEKKDKQVEKTSLEKDKAEQNKQEQKSDQTGGEAAKAGDKKSTPSKREKKIPKPILDDFALFSTPDIIRRVGGKEPTTPVTPEAVATPGKPAKITQESRAKSTDSPSSSGTKSSSRQSLDGYKSDKDKDKDKHHHSAEKNHEKSKEIPTPKERRISNSEKTSKRTSVDEKVKTKDKQQEQSKTLRTYSKLIVTPNETAVENPSEEFPSAEQIRAMIGDGNEESKSFTTDSISIDAEINSSDPSTINLDATGLDLDPTLLDNLNNDEISEEVLYQVAQSLVSNPELQNAIDKGINEGVLPMAVDQDVVPSDQSSVSVQESPREEPVLKGMQIVRPNGRIVVIPPIERPTTRSRNKKVEEKKPTFKPVHKPLDEEHVSGNELDSSDDNEEESEDDPNKLWCICNQPHNNRFMICCDTCEEWYHGKCVNITKTMGQQMEAEGKEWICLFCKDPSLKRPLAAARRIRKASRNSRASTDSTGSATKKPEIVPCVVCQKPARKSSIYCSEACILTHAQGIERVVVFERATGKMLTGNKAPSAANLDQWLKEHKGYEVLRSGGKVVTAKGGSLTQSKLKLVKNEENNGVSLAVQKKGLNLGVLKHSPKQQIKTALKATITGIKLANKPLKDQKNKSFEIQMSPPVAPAKPKSQPTTPSTTTPNKEKQKYRIIIQKDKTPATPAASTNPLKEKLMMAMKEKSSASPKEPATPKVVKEKLTPNKEKSATKVKAKQPETTPPAPKPQENIRENVQKTVYEQLLNRLKGCEDIKLTDEEVKNISTEIESQLYKCFGDTGQKYRNKYRSLIFNIKDAKNHTLWRRICEKSIGPYELVRLSPDDMASQELAKWRENEAKHSIDMIKKSELELLNCNRQYVLKTHKGEQVVEDERVDKTDNAEVIKSLTEGSTLDVGGDAKSDSKDRDKKSSKHSHKDRDRKSSREKDHKSHRSRSSSRERSRKRSRSRDRHHKKHSRDRDRHRKSTSSSSSHKSSRHKKDIISTTDKLDKKSKEILESLVDNKIVPPLEDKLWKHVPQEDIVPDFKAEESDSDHEPSSTVTIPTPPRAPEEDVSGQINDPKNMPLSPELEKTKASEIVERSTSPPPKSKPAEIWRGVINMIDVAQISITAHEVSGDCNGLGKELSENLDIVGRISPDTVWEYIGKMKCSNSKGISLIRLKATNMEERMPYLALYSYLSSRDRLGVVKSTNKAVKDFYIYPLAPQKPIPQVLLPLNGPGFEESRPALLLGIIVRDKRKSRPYIESVLPSELYPKKSKIEATPPPPLPSIPPPVVVPPPLPRSYTPPPMKDPRLKIPILPPAPPTDEGDEPYSPGDSSPDAPPPLLDQPSLMPSALKTSIVDSLLPTTSYSTLPVPGSAALPSSTLEIQRQMEELNKKIEAEKSEITSMTKNIVSASTEIGSSALASIALPSNLQQILDSIKTIGETSSEPNPVPAKEPATQTDLTIPLMIPKTFTRPLNNLPAATAIPAVEPVNNTIPLNLPSKLKIKPQLPAQSPPMPPPVPPPVAPPPEEKSSSVLGSLSEEDLIRKAAEMLGEDEVKVKKKTDKDSVAPPLPKRAKHEISLPPVPGLEDEVL